MIYMDVHNIHYACEDIGTNIGLHTLLIWKSCPTWAYLFQSYLDQVSSKPPTREELSFMDKVTRIPTHVGDKVTRIPTHVDDTFMTGEANQWNLELGIPMPMRGGFTTVTGSSLPHNTKRVMPKLPMGGDKRGCLFSRQLLDLWQSLERCGLDVY